MGIILHDPPFERWVQYLFNHPVTDPAWYWDLTVDQVDVNPRLVVAYVTRLFEESGALLAEFSDGQLNHGLWFLVSTSEVLYALRDKNVALDHRIQCVRSISQIFQQLFAERCTPHLSHLEIVGASPLNRICYMWWDILSHHGQPNDPSRRAVDSACLEVMEETLALPSIACQESALHGLGHWALYYPERCSEAVDGFLASHPRLSPNLVEYAKCARTGMVQ